MIIIVSYFVTTQIFYFRYLTDQLQKVHVVNEANKAGLAGHPNIFFEFHLDFIVVLLMLMFVI